MELQPFNAAMSKRAEQVARNLAHFEKEWRTTHPDQELGSAATSRLIAMAWDHERPHKRPTSLGSEAAWRAELEDAGYRTDLERTSAHPPVSLDDVSVRDVASRALDRCAAAASTWTVHDIQDRVTRIITEAGVRADPEPLRELVMLTTRLAADDCLSALPPDSPHPEHVAHLTSVHVIAAETRLRDLLMARAAHAGGRRAPDLTHVARRHRLDAMQVRAVSADFVNLIWPRGDVLKWPRRGVGSMWGAVCCQAQQEVGSSLRKRFAVRRMPSAMVRYGAHVSASWVTVNPALMA